MRKRLAAELGVFLFMFEKRIMTMKDESKRYFGFFASADQGEKLETLARETDRSVSGVIRKLIDLSDLPEARRRLGETEADKAGDR